MADKAIIYDPINWKDYPDTSTPVSAENLGKMDTAIDALNDVATTLQGTTKNHQDRIAAIETNKPETTYVKKLIADEVKARTQYVNSAVSASESRSYDEIILAKQDVERDIISLETSVDSRFNAVGQNIQSTEDRLQSQVTAIRRYLGI